MFQELSSDMKTALTKKYSQLTAESRNERGTIVFLLGRNITTPEDFDFLSKVVLETPCLSLNDCSQTDAPGRIHDEGQTAVTLAYPQVVALKSLGDYLQRNPNSPQARTILKEASQSKI